MIVSFEHNFIFLKTTKTAGTSFEIALSKYLNSDDIITPISEENKRQELNYRGAQNYYYPDGLFQKLGILKPRQKFFNHMTAEEVKKTLGSDAFDKFIKVSIIRNPFDYVVSRYFWRFRDVINTTSKYHFQNWLLTIEKEKLLQNKSITHIGGRNVVDIMLRFEHFEADINSFAERLGLPNSLAAEFKSITAKSQIRPKKATAQEMFDGFSEGIDLVKRLFQEDIENYGYKIS